MRIARLYASVALLVFPIAVFAGDGVPFAKQMKVEKSRAKAGRIQANSAVVKPLDHTCTHTTALTCDTNHNAALSTADCLFDDGTYYDVYTFQGSAGQSIRVDMTSTDLDTYLLLRDPSGATVAEDDDGGEGTNSRLFFTLTATGTWTILANNYDSGDTGNYNIAIACGTGGQQPTCSIAPGTISCGATRTGALATNDCPLGDGSYYDEYRFAGTAGQSITINMNSTVFDTYVILVDPTGNVVDSNDDGPDNTDSRLTYTLPTTGQWRILANSYSANTTGAYSLSLTCATVTPTTCVSSTSTLCLQNGRFAVTITGSFNNQTSPGQAISINNQFGYFSIPGLTADPTNVEVLVKIVGPVGGKYWVFYGGLSGFEINVTVTDKQTGVTRTYTKPANTYNGGADFTTF
jgi:hypothetical protein